MNTRLNILLEECLHLQNLLAGMTGREWSFDKCFAIEPQLPLGERKWVLNEPIRGGKYYFKLNSNDKTFLGLIELLGGVAEGINANKHTLTTYYVDAVKDAPNKEKGGTAFFWLVNLRGFYLEHVIGKHTKVLQSVHEKIVQLLETFPTAVPQPILLRRWNSSLHEGFLARYSRHVNWETCMILGNALWCGGKDEIGNESRRKINEMWSKTSVVHTWAYSPDSVSAP